MFNYLLHSYLMNNEPCYCAAMSCLWNIVCERVCRWLTVCVCVLPPCDWYSVDSARCSKQAPFRMAPQSGDCVNLRRTILTQGWVFNSLSLFLSLEPFVLPLTGYLVLLALSLHRCLSLSLFMNFSFAISLDFSAPVRFSPLLCVSWSPCFSFSLHPLAWVTALAVFWTV